MDFVTNKYTKLLTISCGSDKLLDMTKVLLPEPRRKTVPARIYEETQEIVKELADLLDVSQIEVYRVMAVDYRNRLVEAGLIRE